jgi:tRNA threonylcarbamoyladenosine biosynthesis protein TsaE
VTLTQPQLEAWGERIGAAGPPLFLALRGDLGAGKSVLARAIARGAGVTTNMPSPTYNLLFRYGGRAGIEVVHLDLYRLDKPADAAELGFRELGDAHEIVIIEWAERAESLLPPDRWDVHLDVADPSTRDVRLQRHGTARELPAPES